jgi:hypothetical protein
MVRTSGCRWCTSRWWRANGWAAMAGGRLVCPTHPPGAPDRPSEIASRVAVAIVELRRNLFLQARIASDVGAYRRDSRGAFTEVDPDETRHRAEAHRPRRRFTLGLADSLRETLGECLRAGHAQADW